MPQECKGLVDDLHTMLVTTSKMLNGIPFHKLWKNKNWKTLVSSMDGMLSYAGGLVNEKVKKIELAEEGDVGLETEEGMDFLTYMLHSSSGKMTVEEIAVNAIDLILAGVDTVSESLIFDVSIRISLTFRLARPWLGVCTPWPTILMSRTN